MLQRWISPDPLAIHAPGEADLNLYAYVHGRVLVAVDPVGLQEAPSPAVAAPAIWLGAELVAELAELVLAGTVLGTSVAASTKADHDIDRRRAEHLGKALVQHPPKPLQSQQATMSGFREAGQAQASRIKREQKQRAEAKSEVKKSAPADPNGQAPEPRKPQRSERGKKSSKPTDPDVETKAGEPGGTDGSKKEVKRNIEVPERKPTAGEKKQQKRDARTKGQGKAETKKGNREHTRNARQSTKGDHQVNQARQKREQEKAAKNKRK